MVAIVFAPLHGHAVMNCKWHQPVIAECARDVRTCALSELNMHKHSHLLATNSIVTFHQFRAEAFPTRCVLLCSCVVRTTHSIVQPETATALTCTRSEESDARGRGPFSCTPLKALWLSIFERRIARSETYLIHIHRIMKMKLYISSASSAQRRRHRRAADHRIE